jgi:hypothetical protein
LLSPLPLHTHTHTYGAGYVAGQYVLGKISEARQRMGEDRIAKEK